MPRRSRRSAHRGFTLIELMISVTLLGIIGTLLTAILTRQQRFHRTVVNMTDARARMRDIATILPTDIRSISSAGKDILFVTDTSIQFRAFVGTSILCRFSTGAGVSPAIIELPPQELAATAPINSAVTRSSVISSWINPPAPQDIAYVYDQGTKDGNIDDVWVPFRVSDTSSAADATWCPPSTGFTTANDNAARRYKISLDSAPSQTRVIAGAVLRFAREVRYSIYKSTADDAWYVGYQRCTPHATYNTLGSCGTREVLAGPVLAGAADTATSGFYFIFRNKSGTRITSISSSDTIASITVGIRTSSESLLGSQSTDRSRFTGGDSLKFTVGIRNRI
jgi:prepilin-type N-terminal cleavage/methylation domain-containing protein